MSLKANGNWESQVRQEGQFSKVVEKKGSQRGTWKLEKDNKYLLISVNSGDDFELDWKVGNEYKYKIESLDEKNLILLKEDSGKKITWIRMRAKKKVKKSDGGGTLITTRRIDVSPIIVNLKKRSPYSTDRYVCVKYHIIEKLEKPVAKIKEGSLYKPLAPDIREKILLYLSSLKYKEINKFEKVKKATKAIKNIISPYFNGLLKEFVVDNIIIAGSKGSIEEFIIQYPEQMVRFGLKPATKPPPAKDTKKK